MSLSRAQNIFMATNINSVVLLFDIYTLNKEKMVTTVSGTDNLFLKCKNIQASGT